MSDVITTKRIDGYRLSIVLDSVRGGYHFYDVLLDAAFNGEPCCIGQITFSRAHDREDLQRATAMLVSSLQETLTALVKTLPDAESVKNGVHEL
jgi:hypothetical protein